MMQTDAQVRKTRGRLSRHVQNKLGETLHAMFDEIVKEGVPDRFSQLLDQINGGKAHGRQGDHQGDHQAEPFSRASDLDAAGRNPDSLVKTKSPDQPFQKPDDKGSS